jgi:trimeric autotransporter adhesin
MYHSRLGCVSLMLAMLLLAVVTQAQTPAVSLVPEITTVAGNGTAGYSGTELNDPAGVAVDSVRNLYFADQGNDRIRKVNATTGAITTVAGNGSFGHSGDGGQATSAQLNTPKGIAFGGGSNLYIADNNNHRIRKVNTATGVITTVAGNGTGGYSGDGGKATSAELHFPNGVAADSAGNLYIADYNNQRIRKVSVTTGIITTVAGNGALGFSGDGGAATSAKLNDPASVVVDLAGNLYIADYHNNRIRKVNATTGIITTVAGGGSGCAGQSDSVGDGCAATSAELSLPRYVVVDSSHNLYISDSQNERIRKVSAATGVITTVAGDGTSGYSGDTGPATSDELHQPFGVAEDSAGNLYIADSLNNRIRKASGTTSPVIFPETAVGSSSASQKVLLRINSSLKITSISVPKSQGGKQEFTVGTIAGCTANGTTTNAGSLCTVPVTAHPGYPGWRQVPLVVQTSAGTFNFGMESLGLGPQPVLLPGVIKTVAGTGAQGYSGDGGPATKAELGGAYGVAVDSAGNLYIADPYNYRVRKVSAATGVITTVAGNGTLGYSGDGGPATKAEFTGSLNIAVDSASNLYIVDLDYCVIRKVSAATGLITTVVGNGTQGYSGDGGPATKAELGGAYGAAVDSAGNLYIADTDNQRIRKVSAATGVITTVAGNGTQGYSGDGGPATKAELNFPVGVAEDSAGDLYIGDPGSNVIRVGQDHRSL